jgi:cysteine desulfurase / selenocysteine lyase
LKNLERFRSEFPIVEEYTFLNHAAVSPLSRRVVRAVSALSEDCCRRGISLYPSWQERIREVRALFGALIHAEGEEIAFVGNTSDGLSAVAGGFPWKPGDKVLIPEPEFPANIYPWMNLERLGVEVRFMKRREGRIGPEDVKRSLAPGVRMISVSSVDFSTGHACNLKALGELCREKGLFFCVDGIQSLGVLPMDVKDFGIHFLSSGGHKWLLGPMGCGGLYISKEVNPLVHPLRVGWKSVEEEEDFFRVHFDLKSTAEKFEPGTLNLMGIYGLGAAMDLLFEIGLQAIRERIMELQDHFLRGLRKRDLRVVTPLGEGERSGILSFAPRGEAKALFHHLLLRKVMVSERGGLIRISPHFYNNEEDLQRFFEALDAFGPGRS